MKPRIKISKSIQYWHWWICEGKHSDGFFARGFGRTPNDAYREWNRYAIPF
jgi:hypothetical protein